MELYCLIWEIGIFIICFILMFYALQALDFSKLFRSNSTKQIKIVILFVSAAVSFMIALGIGEILQLISSLK